MEFTDEQRKRIDALLAEGEEYNKKMGNKKYTHEEFWNLVNKDLEEIRNEKIQDRI